jgi:hypothetical protein
MASELMAKEAARSGPGTFLRLLGLFVIIFLIVFIFSWVWDMFAEEAQKQVLQSAPASRQTVLTMDPNIEKELTKVLAMDEAEPTAELRDPFSDRSDLSSEAERLHTRMKSRSRSTSLARRSRR